LFGILKKTKSTTSLPKTKELAWQPAMRSEKKRKGKEPLIQRAKLLE